MLPEKAYKLIDGLLIWRDMNPANSSHDEFCSLLCRLAHIGAEKANERVVSFIGTGHIADKNSYCFPDVTIFSKERKLGSDLSPESEAARFHKGKYEPLLSIEVTSKGTYSTDMETKWRKYAEGGNGDYVVIARDHPICGKHRHLFTGPAVIVGTRSSNSKCAQNGYPDCTKTVSQSTEYQFSKRIFRGSKKVECMYFSHLDITAQDLLDCHRLSIKVDMLELEERKYISRLVMDKENAERDKKTAEKVKETSKKDKETAEKRIKTAEKQKENAEKRMKTAEKDKETAKQRMETAEKGKETAEKRMKAVEKDKEIVEKDKKSWKSIKKSWKRIKISRKSV